MLRRKIASRGYFKNEAEAVELVKLGSSKDSIVAMGGIQIQPDIRRIAISE
jgi:hypothetical protein